MFRIIYLLFGLVVLGLNLNCRYTDLISESNEFITNKVPTNIIDIIINTNRINTIFIIDKYYRKP